MLKRTLCLLLALALLSGVPVAVAEDNVISADVEAEVLAAELSGENGLVSEGQAVQPETPVAEQPAEAQPETPVAEQPAEAEPAAEATPAPDMSSDEVAEYDPAQAEVPEEYLAVEDENGEAEQPAEAPAEAEQPAEAGEAPAEDGQAAETPVETTNYGPQVVAIVPYGESFTYSTQIRSDGNARVEATDEPFETVSFTQTMRSYMRPTDFASKYSTQYKLQGNEAGAGFELTLNDYTGEATIVPQNVIDVSLRSESGNTVERGYQLMDAEIAGNYGIALTTNTPKMLYKRYQYSNTGEEMAYLVVTTYNDGATQQILFELESNEPEPEEETVYTILQRGIKSDEVANLQARLIQLGYLTGTADGSFGAMTEEAIKKAQEAFGMEANGVADGAFQQKLFEGAPAEGSAQSAAPVTYATLDTKSTGEAVMNMQLKLREQGFYDGKADGGFGPMTEAAVKKAQAAFGMEQTGIADSDFQNRLYNGPTDEENPEG